MVGNQQQHKDVLAGQWLSACHALPFLYSLLTLPLSCPHPSLTFLPHNLSLPPFPLAFSTFPFSLLAPLHFNDLLDISRTHHIILPDIYSGLLSRQIFLRVRSTSRIARNSGFKPPQPADACCARGCDYPRAVSTHLLHPQLTLCRKNLCLRMGCGT